MALVMRYAVLFCRAGSDQPESIEWFGETAADAIADVQDLLGVQFRSAKAQELEAVIDTTKFGFNKEEAAYLCGTARVDDYMARGWLPKPREGMAVRFTREHLFGLLAPKSNGS